MELKHDVLVFLLLFFTEQIEVFVHFLDQFDVFFFLLVKKCGNDIANFLLFLIVPKWLEQIKVVNDEAQLSF